MQQKRKSDFNALRYPELYRQMIAIIDSLESLVRINNPRTVEYVDRQLVESLKHQLKDAKTFAKKLNPDYGKPFNDIDIKLMHDAYVEALRGTAITAYPKMIEHMLAIANINDLWVFSGGCHDHGGNQSGPISVFRAFVSRGMLHAHGAFDDGADAEAYVPLIELRKFANTKLDDQEHCAICHDPDNPQRRYL